MSKVNYNTMAVAIPNEAGWPLKRLDEICSLVSRGTAPVYVEYSNVSAIGQRCVTASGFAPEFARSHSDRAMSGVLHPKVGDVLLNSTGAGTIGRSAVFDSPGAYIVDGHITVLRCVADEADGRWLNEVLHTSWVQNHLERFCYSGSTNQIELGRKPLASSALPTPEPSEQSVIIRVADAIQSAIHETEAIIEKLKAVKQGLLRDLLTRGIDANGELRPSQNEKPHLYKQSPLGWLPNEWHFTNLDSISTKITSGSRDWAGFYSEEGALFLRIGNLSKEHINLRYESVVFVRPSMYADGQRTRLEPGDILISITADLGIIGVVPRNIGESYINQHIALVRLDSSRVNTRFFGHYLAGPVAQLYINKLNDAGAKAGLNLPAVRGLFIASPVRDEQDAIADRLDEIDNRIDSATTEMAKLQAMKVGLVDDLLAGRVLVTPLLERAC